MADEEKKAKKKKKKGQEPEKPKRSLKGTSRLFMGFRDRTPKISKKGQFRSASAFFWGLHTGPQKTKRKRKARTVLQSTSKLMTQMRMGKKKRAMRGKKPSFMVIRFPGRRGYGRLRPRAQSLSKASTAINWLTKRFLIKKAEESGSEQAAVDAWLSRSGSHVGSRKLPFPSGAEILRPGGRLRRFPRSRSIYASGPVGFLPFEDEAPFRHAGSRRSLYGLEGFQDLGEYYDYHREGDAYYDQRSLSQYEEQDPGLATYGAYSPAWPPYGDHAPGYPPEDPYDHYPLDYYGGPYYPTSAYGYSYGYEDHEPPYAPPGGYASPYSYYDSEPYPQAYYLDPFAPYDAPYLPYDLPYDVPAWEPYGVPYEAPYGLPYAEGIYGGGDQAIYPPEVPYLYPEEPAFAYPWVPPPIMSPHNPYAHPMDDIAELEEPEEAAGERQGTSFRLPSASFFEQQGMDKPARSKLSLIRRFRLFPRPQVKLFGKEKLEVPLPPSLDIPLPLGEEEEEEDEEEVPPVRTGPYAHPFWGFLTPRQRNLQRALSAFGAHRAHRGLGFGPELGPARPATSLARFLKKTLSEKKPVPRLGGSQKARRGGPAVREAAYKRFGLQAGGDPDRPNTPIMLRPGEASRRAAGIPKDLESPLGRAPLWSPKLERGTCLPPQHQSSPWTRPSKTAGRAFSRPRPIPETPFLQHLGPGPSRDSPLEDADPAVTGVFLGRHHDPGPGELTKSASPSPEKPKEEASPGNPRPLAEPEPPSPEPPKNSPPEQKVLRLSLSHPLAARDRMRATWPPWRRWGTLPSAPAPLKPTGAPGPLPRAGERHQAGPGRLAVVLPRVQKPSSPQRAGPATLQPPTQLTKDPEPSLKPRAWSLLWASLWLPAGTHRPWPRAPACPASCRLGPEAAFLPHGGPWEEVGPKSWWNKMHSIRNLPSTRFLEQHREDGVEDMTQLEDLQETTVLSNLKTRFERNLIYTYIGSILVSVNPYRMFGIYGLEQVHQYSGRALGENPPHLFAIANLAFAKMLDAKQNQCIIISGESGSGKTEATKLILRYLASINQKRGIMQQIKILEATPLLESFGNAKTVRNDNSSRFGKFVEIFLEGGVISGAITSQYLLEKSRIVFQAKNERNYHIFYELLAGLPAQLRQAFSLQEAETYYYLNQTPGPALSGKSDADDFRRLLAAMEVLGFSGEDQDSIFRILASILHLGNVYFEKYETDAQEVASVVSAREIQAVAELLQISPEGLQKAITFKVTETIREKIFTPLTVESAVDARDAIAKVLYALLFGWLITRVNALVSPQQDALSIAILDIYGFEDLSFNSFEQLCINYANENLQYLFNKIIFQEEQEEYLREQIDWREVAFADNQPCINLISLKPYGILRILDDQCCFPQATDHTFLQKCHYHHGANPLYSKPKMPLPEFTIKHYAGKVTYQVHKFLDKNHDQVRKDVLDLFVRSRTRVVARLFSSHAPQAAPQRLGKSSSITRLHKAHTVAAKFQQSLLDLIEKMERCNPLFVRCLKPNHKKEPGLFEADVVMAQLRYSGLLETVRIRKEGFPVRLPFQAFIDRYRCLVALEHNLPASGDMCVSVLSRLCTVMPNMYRVGVSKLFLKEHLHQLLESMREHVRNLAALTLQRCLRGFFIQRRFRSLRCKIILLQSRARGYLARQRYQQMRKSLVKFRSLVNTYVSHRRHLKLRAERRLRVEEVRLREQEELSKREVVAVGHLEVPAELAGLLRAVAGLRPAQMPRVAPVRTPRLQAEPRVTLPLDINNYPMAKFVRCHFKEPAFGMLTVPLRMPLTGLPVEHHAEAVSIFKLVLRFMGDPHLHGAQEHVFGNYIVQKGLAVPELRDEILAQLANQVWRNPRTHNAERGWLLLAACLSGFAPSSRLNKYLLKFVSDYGRNGFQAVCQHRLMQAMGRAQQQGPGAARTFPPTRLEWTAAQEKASMALDVGCFNGDQFSCPVHSWSTGEELAGDILRHRGLVDGWRGWTVAMKNGAQWAELAGHDYVLDLVSDLELLRDFPRQKSYFIVGAEGPVAGRGGPRAVFGNSWDSDEDTPTRPQPRGHMPNVADANGYCSPHEDRKALGLGGGGISRRKRDVSPLPGLDSPGEPAVSHKGLDCYLDSLFDPVLSCGDADLEKPTAIAYRMKGGGQPGGGGGSSTEDTPKRPPEPKPIPGLDASTLALQQAFIHKQAVLLAREMTLQAMALQQQPLSPAPRPFPPEKPQAPRGTAKARGHETPGQAVLLRPTPKPVAPAPPAKAPRPPLKPVAAPILAQDRSSPETTLPCPELVRYSTLNSEHFPQPTQQIKNIVRQYQQPPQGGQPQALRKDCGRVFVKRPDPHEEALMILKGQMSHLAAAPGTQVPREAVALVKPVTSAPRPSMRPTPALPSRSLEPAEDPVQTQLHRLPNPSFYGYQDTPWQIFLRKEVFYPKDSYSHPVQLDLLFRQVRASLPFLPQCTQQGNGHVDYLSAPSAQSQLDHAEAAGGTKSVEAGCGPTPHATAWEVYFRALVPTQGSVGTGVQILAVHTGIKLLQMARGSREASGQLRVLRTYSFADILFVTIPSRNMLEFNLASEKVILFSARAQQVKTLVDDFILELKKPGASSELHSCCAPQPPRPLRHHCSLQGNALPSQAQAPPPGSWRAGRVLRALSPRETPARLRLLPPPGWRLGTTHGRVGRFPSELVQPVAAPDFLQLPAEPSRGRAAAVAAAVASTAAAWEVGRRREGSPIRTGSADRGEDGLAPPPRTMLAFAQKYFRDPQRRPQDGLRLKSKEGRESRTLEDMLCFTKSPLQESLIELSDASLSKMATDMFLAVMRFMGDAPLKGQRERDVLCTLLKLCAEQEALRDECYCQVVKQLTDRASSDQDSCQRGWRLLYILTAYHSCSEVLRPPLVHFLQDVSQSPGLPFQGIAKACEQNLQKTLRFGGRLELPSSMELRALLAGRSSKRQLFFLPGGLERHLKIKTCTVALDVVKEICAEMALTRPEAFDEYVIFLVTNRGQHVCPLRRCTYILDVASEIEHVESSYMLWSRVCSGTRHLSLRMSYNVTMHYNQVLPDYLKGLFSSVPAGQPREQQLQQVSKLASLQHRAKDHFYLPSMREVQQYIPAQLFHSTAGAAWLSLVSQHRQQTQALSPHQARAQFLGLLSASPMFGSSFFFIQSCSNLAVPAPSILAVNQNGLNFLSTETHELMVKFPLKEIQSTWTQRPTASSSYPYVEIVLGDVAAQCTMQLQLEQGLELCRVVAVHVENLLSAREKQLTLPPSEITLL
uniref:Unconventional myosin-XV n=1 Tax=Myotis lucifugus TaxID=59463 RepID=G1NVB2_MYOLU